MAISLPQSTQPGGRQPGRGARSRAGSRWETPAAAPQGWEGPARGHPVKPLWRCGRGWDPQPALGQSRLVPGAVGGSPGLGLY